MESTTSKSIDAVDFFLAELENIFQRVNIGNPPPREEVLARLPYLLTELSRLLGQAADITLLCQVLGRSETGGLYSLITSPNAANLADSPEERQLTEAAQRWYSAHEGPALAATKFDNLPIWNDEQVYKSLTKRMEEWVSELSTEFKTLKELAKDVDGYEHFGPPSARGIYDRAGDPALHPLIPPGPMTEEELDTWTNEQLPSDSVDMDLGSWRDYSPQSVVLWIQDRAFYLPGTDVVAGGQYGVRIGLCMVLRIVGHMAEMPEPDGSPGSDKMMPKHDMYTPVRRCIKLLRDQISSSREILSGTVDARRRSRNRSLQFESLLSPRSSSTQQPVLPVPYVSDPESWPSDLVEFLLLSRKSPRRVLSEPALAKAASDQARRASSASSTVKSRQPSVTASAPGSTASTNIGLPPLELGELEEEDEQLPPLSQLPKRRRIDSPSDIQEEPTQTVQPQAATTQKQKGKQRPVPKAKLKLITRSPAPVEASLPTPGSSKQPVKAGDTREAPSGQDNHPAPMSVDSPSPSREHEPQPPAPAGETSAGPDSSFAVPPGKGMLFAQFNVPAPAGWGLPPGQSSSPTAPPEQPLVTSTPADNTRAGGARRSARQSGLPAPAFEDNTGLLLLRGAGGPPPRAGKGRARGGASARGR